MVSRLLLDKNRELRNTLASALQNSVPNELDIEDYNRGLSENSDEEGGVPLF
jgi:hypothetical protein